jgi:hypothetical protein
MTKTGTLAIEDDALHEEILRTTIDKPDHELIDGIYKPAGLFLKIGATKPDLLLMDIDLCQEIAMVNPIKQSLLKVTYPRVKTRYTKNDRTRTLY